jgi:hypothetical protein
MENPLFPVMFPLTNPVIHKIQSALGWHLVDLLGSAKCPAAFKKKLKASGSSKN